MKKNIIFIALAIIVCIGIGCHHTQTQSHQHEEESSHKSHQHEHSEDCDHDHDAENLENGSSIYFSKLQASKVNLRIDNPIQEPFGQVIKTVARIEAAQGDEMIVTAKSNGIVLFSDLYITEGKEISKGNNLFSISSKDLVYNNLFVKYNEAKNNYEASKENYERNTELAKDQIVSQKDLAISKNQYENAKALYLNLQQNFSANGESVHCPMGGYIKQVLVNNGEYVEMGQPILIISKNKNLFVIAEVQQKYAHILRNIYSANLYNPITKKGYSLKELNGSIISYGKSTTDANHLLPITLKINNIGDFIPGSFVDIYLKTVENTNAITVPNSALIEEQGIYYVFVEVAQEHYEKREVHLGGTDGLKTVITDGITEKERIVTQGAIYIKLSQGDGKLDAHSGHVH